MSDEVRPLIDRLFGYEELDAVARAEADSALAADPRLRALLDALREREAAARATGALPDESYWDRLTIDEEGSRTESASLDALLARHRRTSPGAPPARVRSRIALAWLVPVAAAAAALLVWPRATSVPTLAPPRPTPARATLAPMPAPSAFVIERAGERRGTAEETWRAGDPFRMRFRLTAPARPVLFVVDGHGALSRLHPSADEVASLAPAGEVELPAAGTRERWTFSGPPGVESFFAVAAPETVDVLALSAAADSAVASAAGRLARIAALEEALRRAGAGFTRLDVTHD